MAPKKKNLFIRYLILSAALSGIVSIESYAQSAGLPYLGRRKLPCSVNTPKSVIETMVEQDENCTTIFVHPPAFGLAQVTSYSGTDNLTKCQLINDINASHVHSSNRLQDALKRKKEKEEKLNGDTSLTDDEIAAIDKELAALTKVIRSLINSVDSTKDFIRQQNSEFGGAIGITLSTLWHDAIREYQAANPKYNVVKLPINYAILTYNMKRLKVTEDLITTEELPEDPVISTSTATLPVKIPAAKPKVGDIPDDPNLDLKAGSLFGAHFGSAVSISMKLSMLGLCPYTKTDDHVRLPGQRTPMAYLAPNVTYTYPIASKSIFKVKVDPTAISKTVNELMVSSDGGKSIEFAQLADALSKNGGGLNFSEESEADIGDNEGMTKEAKAQVKSELIAFVSDSILKNIGNLTKVLESSPLYRKDIVETHTGRRCERSWIFFKSCHNYQYQVVVSKPDWNKIAKKIESLLNTSYESSVSTQRTYQRNGTFTFIPPEEYEKLLIGKRDGN
jgi:hypothetical protein